MKIFRINRLPDMWTPEISAALEREEAPSPDILPVSLMPDSSLVLKGNPVFLPDFAEKDDTWRFHIVPVFRIGRLGKFISPRFACRYVDAVAAGAVLMYGNAEHKSALCSCFDGALTVGPWKDAPDIDGNVTIHAGDSDIALSSKDMRLADTVALLSRFATLRTGDIIIPCLTRISFPAVIGTNIEICIAGAPTAGRLRVK